MSRTLLSTLALVLSLALIGCGNQSSGESQTGVTELDDSPAESPAEGPTAPIGEAAAEDDPAVAMAPVPPKSSASGHGSHAPSHSASTSEKSSSTEPSKDTGQGNSAASAKNNGSGAKNAKKKKEAAKTITITGNDRMQYSINEFTVPAGETIKLIFKNIGTMPRVAMGHNVTILTTFMSMGELSKFAQKAVAAGLANGYIPQGEKAQKLILAHTKLLGPGKTDTIFFTAPKKPGKYTYLCTFPGHWATMNGTMKVVKK